MKSLVAILFVALFGCTLAQINVAGPCRTLPVVSYFDAQSYEGVWYELKRYDTVAEAGLDCSTADYTLNDGGFDVTNAGTNILDGSYSISSGRGYVSFPNETPLRGLLNVTFTDQPANEVNYRVLETDYDTYSLVWNCVDQADGTANEYAWILTKNYEVLAGELQQERVDELVSQYLDASQLRVTVQDETCLVGEISPAPAN